MNAYAATLTDPKWQRKRLEIFERDGWKCLQCHATHKTLHVHHHSYKPDTKPWDYPDSNFATLCCDCHEKKSPGRKFPRKPASETWRERAKSAYGNYPHRAEWPF